MGTDSPWTSPSELGEYAFCPRALHYRRTVAAPPSETAEAGSSFHVRALSRERWRDEHRIAPWIAVLAGLVLLVAAVVVLAS